MALEVVSQPNKILLGLTRLTRLPVDQHWVNV